jgi:tritrans,polycis-undecaprenyl-diphosphate synthase [geranylgeranyl-diphosphate specific]
LDIKELTLYTFSIQNFNRPKNEFDFLMKLFKETFEQFRDDPRIDKYGIKINFIGRWQLFPQDIQDSFRYLEEKTKNNTNYILNFAMAYGGREELLDAIKSIVAEKIPADKITEELVAKHLYMDSEPDIVIRTGGEKRISNFLPWQSIYSELFFIDKMWPEFEKEDLQKILDEYEHRDRRFGK